MKKQLQYAVFGLCVFALHSGSVTPAGAWNEVSPVKRFFNPAMSPSPMTRGVGTGAYLGVGVGALAGASVLAKQINNQNKKIQEAEAAGDFAEVKRLKAKKSKLKKVAVNLLLFLGVVSTGTSIRNVWNLVEEKHFNN